MGPRRKFTDEFKRKAVQLVLKPSNSIVSIAREIGAERSVLADLVKKMQSGAYEPQASKPLTSANKAVLEHLRRELAKV